jgi:hypothetical protein
LFVQEVWNSTLHSPDLWQLYTRNVLSTRYQMSRLCSVGDIVLEEYWLEKTNYAEKPVSLPLCRPQIPHRLPWDRTCKAAAASLKEATKLVMFCTQGLSKGTWMIRCGRRDQLDDVNCGHDEDDDDDSDTWFSSTGGPIWSLSIKLRCLCGGQIPTLSRSLVCRRPVEGVASPIISERQSECDL